MSRRLAALGNALLYTVANLAEYAIGLVVSIVIARTLGPTEFGLFSFAIWLSGTLFFTGNHGSSMSAIRFVAEACGKDDPALARAIAARLGMIQLAGVLIVLTVLAIATALIRPDQWADAPVAFVVLIAVSVAAKARFTFLHANALGHQRYDYAASAPVVSALIYLAVSLVVQRERPDALGFLGGYALTCVLSYLFVAVLLQRGGLSPKAGPIAPDELRRVMKHLWLTAAMVVLGMAANRTIETFVLSDFGTVAEIGFFAIAGTLTKGAVDILTAGLQSTLMPVMAHATGREGPRGMAPIVNTALRYYWFIGLVVAAAGFFASRPVVLLVYGEPYAPAIFAVQLTLAGAGLALTSSVVGAFLATQDRQDDRVRTTGWMLLINLICAFALVPWLGLIGASLTFAITRVGGAAVQVVYFLRGATIRIDLKPCIRMGVAFALATLVGALPYALLPERWGGLIGAVIVLLLGLLLTTVLRAWQRADFQLLTAVLARLGLRSEATRARIQRLEDRFHGDPDPAEA
ncbi:oligosaccharide flippase family protein [Leptothrix sp. BB-4]